jgi:hypothetical protein
MAKKSISPLILLGLAAGAWLVFRNSGMPSVVVTYVDWLNGDAQLLINGEQWLLNDMTAIHQGDYYIKFTKAYVYEVNRMAPDSIVITDKNGTILKTLARR